MCLEPILTLNNK